MAKYVDPSAPSDGLGTIDSPYNTLVGKTPATSEAWYFKRGTTYSGNYFNWPVSGVAGNPVIIGAYGSGNNPIWALPSNQDYALWFNSKSYITIQDFAFTGGYALAGKRILYFSNGHDHNITRCTFNNVTCESAICFYVNGAADMYNLSITSCTFLNMAYNGSFSPETVRYYCGSATNPMRDMIYSFNTHNNIGYGPRLYGTVGTIGANDMSPYGFYMGYNTFETTSTCALAVGTGLKNVAQHPNLIEYNSLHNIGSSLRPNVNAIQLSWTRNTTIQHNTIDTVNTSVPDGSGIIIDYGFTSNSYLSDGNTIRWNKVLNCVAQANAYVKGIAVFKGTNNVIYGNICAFNSVGMGLDSAESTGNVFYNNTCAYNVAMGFSCNNAAPSSVVTNNIFAFNGDSGVAVYNASTVDPTLSYNCFYQNTLHAAYDYVSTSDIAQGAGSVTTNPKFKSISDFHLKVLSPCINAGSNLGTTYQLDYDGKNQNTYGNWEIGAYVYSPGGSLRLRDLLSIFSKPRTITIQIQYKG